MNQLDVYLHRKTGGVYAVLGEAWGASFDEGEDVVLCSSLTALGPPLRVARLPYPAKHEVVLTARAAGRFEAGKGSGTVVVYLQLATGRAFVRSKKEFYEDVEVAAVVGPRFVKLTLPHFKERDLEELAKAALSAAYDAGHDAAAGGYDEADEVRALFTAIRRPSSTRLEEPTKCACVTFDDGSSFTLSSFAGGAAPGGAFSTLSCVLTRPDGTEEVIRYQRIPQVKT